MLHTPDDVFLLPIAGVKVFIVGLENNVVFTDAAGNFHFDTVPAGDVKLAIDGRTATNAPASFYFPEMVMDLNLDAGRANTAMGAMGTLEERAANRDRPGGLPAAAADLDPARREQYAVNAHRGRRRVGAQPLARNSGRC